MKFSAIFLVVVLLAACGTVDTTPYRNPPSIEDFGLEQSINDLTVNIVRVNANADSSRKGWVLLAYTVTDIGTVEDVRIVDEHPAGLHGDAALQVMKWHKFLPYEVAGVPADVPNSWKLFTFNWES